MKLSQGPTPLPHPAIHRAILVVVHRAVRQAFALLQDAGFPLGTAHENMITERLHWVLENCLRNKKNSNEEDTVSGFNATVFGKVLRGLECSNFDNSRPAVKPDLVFQIARDETVVISSVDALFVECKLVGRAHPIADYCDKGIVRFIRGDYAWAMQQAMMLGYVRNDFTIPRNLQPILKNRLRHVQLGQPTPLELVCNSGEGELYVSSHIRSFDWPDDRGSATKIQLFHSWHDSS